MAFLVSVDVIVKSRVKFCFSGPDGPNLLGNIKSK